MKERSIFKNYLYLKWRFLLLFSIAAILSSISTIYFIRYLIKPNTGLVVNFPEVISKNGKVIFSPKTPFSPAVSSGLRPNSDQILRVNGYAVHGIRDVVEADARIWSFDPFPVEVLRNGKNRETVHITPALTPSRLDWVFVLILSIALAFTVFYLIFNLPGDAASNFIALAGLFYLVFTCVKPFYYESFLANSLIHLGKLTSWFMVFFGLYFPTPKGSRSVRLSIIGFILGIYLLFITVRLFYYFKWSAGGEEIWLVRYRFLGIINNISDGIAYVFYAVLLVISYVKTPIMKEKRQIEWILAGFLIAIPPYFFLDQLPIILGEPPGLRISMGNFANLFLVFVPLFFIIGLIKHRVFNIKFFAARYLVYVLLAVIILSFFTVLYEPVERLFIYNYGLSSRVAGFLVTTLLFISLVPLRSLFIKLVEQLFYRSHYRKSLEYSTSLEKRNMELKLIIDELNRQNIRSFQSDKIKELRGIITGIAHRVNNPANYISSSLSSLERKVRELFKNIKGAKYTFPLDLTVPEEEIIRFINIAQEGDLLIKDFVRKLVSLTGPRSAITVSVEVSHLLKNAEIEVRQKYTNAPLKLRVRSSSKLTCYPGEVIQALRYVLENALDANENITDEIVVTAEDKNGYVMIEIEDHGLGIDELNLKKIFDPFFTTKAGHEGLGLYFCKTTIERNSGSIEIRSKAGIGTKVRLILPLDEKGKS